MVWSIQLVTCMPNFVLFLWTQMKEFEVMQLEMLEDALEILSTAGQ